jgi:uncharacterized membrane protein YphA (DoxX/SURF4 family)
VAGPAPRDPRWVDAILDWRWTWLAARIGLTGAYILGGLTKALDFPAAVAEQEHFGLHPGWLWAGVTIAVELVGPALIISGRLVWLGAGMLGVFTGLAALVANAFWRLSGEARFAATNAFFEHVGLIAGFVLAALIAEHAQRERAQRNLTTLNS